MIRLSRLIVLTVVAGASAALSGATANAPTAAPTLKLQRRIDILLKRKIKTEALPVELPNPFQVNLGIGAPRDGALADSTNRATKDDDAGGNGSATSASAAPSNVDILSSIVSRLRFGGMIVLKDQGIKVVINGVQRREGDMVPAEWNNSVVYLKITKVTATEVVLRYNDADASLKF
jgi:hypothetical protein